MLRRRVSCRDAEPKTPSEPNKKLGAYSVRNSLSKHTAVSRQTAPERDGAANNRSHTCTNPTKLDHLCHFTRIYDLLRHHGAVTGPASAQGFAIVPSQQPWNLDGEMKLARTEGKPLHDPERTNLWQEKLVLDIKVVPPRNLEGNIQKVRPKTARI